MKQQQSVLLSNNYLTLIFLLFCPTFVAGQNIVINGDFEQYEECPTDEGTWEGYALGWTTFFGTPNYLNCDWYGANPVITPTPHSGTGLASCVWFDTDYANPPVVEQEYLIGTLVNPLEAGADYYIQYWIYYIQGAGELKFDINM